MVSDTTVHFFRQENDTVAVPDRLLPAHVHEIGSMAWYEDGWGIGDNPRDRFCKWAGAKPLRKFTDYDEAVAFIHRLRQKRKRKNEAYTLVYVTRGICGREASRPVSLLDDILAFEQEVDEEIAANNAAIAERRRQSAVEYPELDQLRKMFGPSTALRMSSLLAEIRRDGMATVKKRVLDSTDMSASTFYRFVRELRQLELIDPS